MQTHRNESEGRSGCRRHGPYDWAELSLLRFSAAVMHQFICSSALPMRQGPVGKPVNPWVPLVDAPIRSGRARARAFSMQTRQGAAMFTIAKALHVTMTGMTVKMSEH